MRFPCAVACPLRAAYRHCGSPGSLGPRDTQPVRAGCSIVREHLPSSRERASFHPHAETSRKLVCMRDVPRTGSPSLHPCPASGGASSFLLASALLIPSRCLATPRWARRAMRPIDLCHLYSMRVPAPRAFPAPAAVCTAWAPHGFWDPCGLTGGPGGSRHPRPLRRIAKDHALIGASAPAPPEWIRWMGARVFSSRGALHDRASDIPVASPSCRPAFAPSRTRCRS